MVLSLLVLVLLTPLPASRAAPLQQANSSRDRAQALLASLKPEEVIGQLFLVTFNGTDIGPDSQIYDLIVNYHVGGVILQAENDNFVPHPQTLPEALQLTRQLQTLEWTATQTRQIDVTTNEEFSPAFIPLFIGISQEGDGPPYDQILNGLTRLPSQMAIGATWKTELANQVGFVQGSELSAIGINLLHGPSLDVLETPRTRGSGDLGVRTFGGEPYWVGEMARAYISGVHAGSAGRMAVVAKHFPGHGSSDRLPEEEVATVRKSFDSLRQIDLLPFEAVTGNATSPQARVDGLLASHIRYQGFQGNIRNTTRPVSLDYQAFSQLMDLPAFASWREGGGIMVTDNLGSRAFRHYAEPRWSIARDAFTTGNDLLFLGSEFVAAADPDSYTTIVSTLKFFAQKYRTDPTFQQRVNESALRILTLKYRLYEDIFTINQVRAPLDGLANVGKSDQLTFDVAQSAATLIHPSPADLAEILPEPPGLNDRIVFITDVLSAKQCSQCPEQAVFAVNALEQAVIALYGPFAGGQVLQRNLDSYSFVDLRVMLDATEQEEILEIENHIQQAQWVVFAILNVNTNDPESQALLRFLAERPDLFREKRLIAFAFDAPYHLDATEVSKLTAYYGLYSKTAKSIEVAARLLFGEIPSPPGSLPVSVPGVDYDLFTATSPDPGQVISLFLDVPQPAPQEGTPSTEPPVSFEVGELIWVRTNVIRDHNGHPVPDGTQVEFRFDYGNETITQLETTRRGEARTSFLINRPGILEIGAESEPARQSTPLRFNIQSENGAGTPAVPTIFPTETPTEEPTPTSTAVPESTGTASTTNRPNLGDWFLGVLVTAGIGGAIYWLTALVGMVRWGVRAAFLALIGGQLSYTYLAVRMPGSEQLVQNTGTWGVLLVILIGAGLGWGAALGWQKMDERVIE